MARDERGRYHSLKEITANGPAWASGCSECNYGIRLAPDLTGVVSLHLERLVQAVDGDITFCDCQAGQSYRKALLARFNVVKQEDARNARVVTHKVAGSDEPLNPLNTLRIDSSIDIARVAIEAARANHVPTVHLEKETA